MKRLVLVAVLAGCATTAPDGGLQLTGTPAAVFRRITNHEAMALSDQRKVYAGKKPPTAFVICHEGEHGKQYRVLTDALVGLGAIDDDEDARMLAWIALYNVDWIQYGYEGSRYEKGANEACKHLR